MNEQNIHESNHPLYKDLYHRNPYLLIDSIGEDTPDLLVANKLLKGDEFYFRGHFPHAPILPGAMMQEMSTQAAGVLIARHHNPIENYDTENFDPKRLALGVLSRVKDAKFKNFAKPGDRLEIRIKLIEKVDTIFEFTGEIHKFNSSAPEGLLVMKNRFILSNISSEYLVS